MAVSPKPQFSYAFDDLADGGRLVRTVGLTAIGQMELAAMIPAGRPHASDHAVIRVLDFVAGFTLRGAERILPEETVEYGWTLLRWRQRSPELLEAHEIQDVYSQEPEPPMVPGVQRAIRLAEAGFDVVRRNRLPGRAHFPYRGRGAIICIHLSEADRQPFFMERDEPLNPNDSGWAICCGKKEEEHDENELFIEHLAHIAAHRPFIVPYLAMPAGCGVRFVEEGAVVWPPGSDEGRFDPADPYTFGPWSVSR